MSQNFDDDEDDAPLDPALERTRLRLRRLILISGATLGLGLFAVFGAILYKVMQPGATVATKHQNDFARTFDLPAGYQVLSISLDDGMIAIAAQGPEGIRIFWYDRRSGREIAHSDVLSR